MAFTLKPRLVIVLIFLLSSSCLTYGKRSRKWKPAHATFYGDENGGGTTSGACGYEDTTKEGYGYETTALSGALFNNGAKCGSCYKITCYNSTQWCKKGSIHVTATNFCPSSNNSTGQNWCNMPQHHFDLSMPMFLKIAEYRAGIVPVLYRRVMCRRQGGIRFRIQGNPNWLMVLVFNVAGNGVVKEVQIKGSNTEWKPMSRNWGENWQVFDGLVGQSLSFQVKTMDDLSVVSYNVAPSNWQYGVTYEGKQVVIH